MSDFDAFYVATLILPMLGIYLLNKVYKLDKAQFSPQGKVVVWNILLTLNLAAVLFLVGETYFRFFVDTTDSFGLNKLTERWTRRHYVLNNYFWRDNIDYVKEKDTTKLRITFMGDSFTVGHGIKNVEDRFVNLIRAQRPDWEIHALATNGWETPNQWDAIKTNKEIEYETDVVVLVYNLNDISLALPETKTIYESIFSFQSELSYLFRESYLLNTMAFRWRALRDSRISDYYGFVENGYFGEPWIKQARMLELISKELSSRGQKLMVVTFPMLHSLEQYRFEAVHQQLNKFWQTQSVPHLDLLPTFKNEADKTLTVNPWDAHPNEFAHRIAMEVINDFIGKNVID